jgi:nucleoside-diphosphate-sugar epimerase
MKVFVAGASGAIGRWLVPMLVGRGHEVTGMTRSPAKQDLVRRLGARAVVADALEPEAVAQALAQAEPEVVIHELTAIDPGSFGRSVDKTFAQTNRLRLEGTDHLLAAAKAAGTRRFVAQSFAPWVYKRVGGPVKAEDDPVDDTPPRAARQTVAAIRHVEESVTRADGIEGIVLRYGGFYGPGTSIALDPDGEQVQMIRKGRLPIVGDGGGVWSLVHVEDAALATVAAAERGAPGVYNVVDDEPVSMAELLPELARTVGARSPRRVPRWLGRLVGGQATVVMMTEFRGASNEKAKRELGWELRYPSWRLGLREGLSDSRRAALENTM